MPDYDSDDDQHDKEKRKSAGFGSSGGSSSAFSRFYSGNAGGAGIGSVVGGGGDGGGGGDEGGKSVGRYNPLFHNAVSFVFVLVDNGQSESCVGVCVCVFFSYTEQQVQQQRSIQVPPPDALHEILAPGLIPTGIIYTPYFLLWVFSGECC